MEGIRLETDIRNINGTRILDVAGEIDVYTATKFRESIETILNAGQKHVIINMANVNYMDSSGFGALLSATKKLKPIGGSVNLIKCSSAIDRILKITRLDTIFDTYDSVDDANTRVFA